MPIENAVVIVGTITRDPELKFIPSGQALLNLGIAQNSRKFNKDTQEWEDGDARFFDATVWGPLAENAAETLNKGHRVIVVGTLDYEKWETPEGDNRSKVKIKVDAIGPDLKWATAEVTKITRESGGGSQRPATAPSGGNDNPFL